jgi:hypothetical protein
MKIGSLEVAVLVATFEPVVGTGLVAYFGQKRAEAIEEKKNASAAVPGVMLITRIATPRFLALESTIDRGLTVRAGVAMRNGNNGSTVAIPTAA